MVKPGDQPPHHLPFQKKMDLKKRRIGQSFKVTGGSTHLQNRMGTAKQLPNGIYPNQISKTLD
jgi:hypothetical protein